MIKKFIILGSLLSSFFATSNAQDCCEEYAGNCCPRENSGWHLQKELLYWTTHESGLEYTDRSSDVLTTDNFTTTPLVHPDFHWEYGFRLAAGYTLCESPWTFQLSWLWLASKATGKKIENSGPPDFRGIFPIWSMSPDTLPGDYVSSARMRWHLHTNLIDFDAKRDFCFGERYMLTTLLGIRGAIMTQKLHVKYEGGTFFSGIDDNIMRNNFYGAGPRAGLKGEVYLLKGISLCAGFDVAPLYGHFRTTHHEEYLEATRLYLKGHHNNFVWSFDYRVGIQWQGIVFESWPVINLMLSWEGQEFLRFNRLARGPYHFFKRNRDLTLEGWTLTAGLNF